MEKSAPTKNAPLGIFVSYHLPRGNRARVSLNFDHVWVGPDLYQIWSLFNLSTMVVLIPLTIHSLY